MLSVSKLEMCKLTAFASALFLAMPASTFAENLPLHQLTLPKGFHIETYVRSLPDARSMTPGSKGTLFVGTRSNGKVYAVTPNKKVYVIASDLNMPNGVAFKDGTLYVAEMNRVIKFDNIESHLSKPPQPIIISTALPDKEQHGWRYIKFGTDNKLYIGVGAPCNACLSKNPVFATIMRMNKDGSDFEIYAKGVRNSVGFDWHPTTKQLWFTDNGRDWMGDNQPPDEINHAPKIGMNFGYPYCHGKDIADPKYGKDFPCSKFTPATYDLPAHVAPLGLTFYTGNMFPHKYHNKLIIAEHGSWNRTSKVGYQVIIASEKDGKISDVKPLVSGWLKDGKVWGRPVDVLVMPDGALLISDDHAGTIYRVSYKTNT